MPNSKPPNPLRPVLKRGEQPPKIKFPTRVRRLRLLYSKNKWETIADIILDSKTLRSSTDVPPSTGHGFWYELRDRRGRLLYRGKSPNPFEPSLEVFEPDGSIHRVPLKRKEVCIELLIPDLPEGIQLQIFSSITPDGARQKRCEIIRTITLSGDQQNQEKGDHGCK